MTAPWYFHYLPRLDTLPDRLRETILNEPNLCPPKELIFKAFDLTPLGDVKVVILGQDPYHTPGKANGLAFGHAEGYEGGLNSSLRNIQLELGRPIKDLTLESWAKQGVLLLNTRLTTIEGRPMAHEGMGWENEISYFLERLGDTNPPHVYMLWGREAQSYKRYINDSYNLVLEASHPSPYSARATDKPFIGCNHFEKANQFLKSVDREPINW